eukprot:jgi/Botrbrau1/4627/Bobra.60_2s0110.1
MAVVVDSHQHYSFFLGDYFTAELAVSRGRGFISFFHVACLLVRYLVRYWLELWRLSRVLKESARQLQGSCLLRKSESIRLHSRLIDATMCLSSQLRLCLLASCAFEPSRSLPISL